MKKVLWIVILLIIPLFVIVFRATVVRQFFPQASAQLEVVGDSSPMVLYVDNRLVGTLPIDTVSLTAGVHTLSLRNVIGGEGSHVWWQEEVVVGRGDYLKLIIQTRDDTLIGAVLVRLITTSSTISRVFIEPTDSTVWFNETAYSNPPILLPELAPGTYSIRTEHPVYPEVVLDIEVPSGTSIEVRIELFLDLVKDITRQDELTIDNVNREQSIKRRWDWGAIHAPIPIDAFLTDEWKRLAVYTADISADNAIEVLLPMIERMFRERSVFVRIPFAFVVDKDGDIFEGLGLWDFDYTTLNLSGVPFSSGEVPILVLGKQVSEKQVQALEHLTSYITQEPIALGRILDAPTSLLFNTQEINTVAIQAKNTGWTVWEDSGDGLLIVQPKDLASRSHFYHPDVWISPDTVARVTDPRVIPGAETTILLTFKAPAYPIKINETYVLVQNGKILAGSEFVIDFTVNGNGVGIEIVDTPTGFLNVRAEASLNSELLGAVFPGERYVLLQSQSEWHQIALSDGTVGWVNGDYVRRL